MNNELKFVTVEEFAEFQLQRFNEILQRFGDYLKKVPEEDREDEVNDFLIKLVESGWLKKEDAANIVYNKEYLH